MEAAEEAMGSRSGAGGRSGRARCPLFPGAGITRRLPWKLLCAHTRLRVRACAGHSGLDPSFAPDSSSAPATTADFPSSSGERSGGRREPAAVTSPSRPEMFSRTLSNTLKYSGLLGSGDLESNVSSPIVGTAQDRFLCEIRANCRLHV